MLQEKPDSLLVLCRDQLFEKTENMLRDIHIVTKTEHHTLSTCPCTSCQAERSRREALHLNGDPQVITVPIRAARVLGLIKNPNPYGSLARQLRLENLIHN